MKRSTESASFAICAAALALLLGASAPADAQPEVRVIAAESVTGPFGPARGGVFVQLGTPWLESDGVVHFHERHVLTFSGDGIWRFTPLGNVPVVERDDAAPGWPDGSVFTTVWDGESTVQTPLGAAFTFHAWARIPGIVDTIPTKWVYDGTEVHRIAAVGELAPGIPGDRVFVSIQAPLLVDARSAVFLAELSPATPTASDNRSVWRWDNGLVSPMLVPGVPSPLLPDGSEVLEVESVHTNRRGNTTSVATIRSASGTTIDGVWQVQGTQLVSLLADRDRPLGLPDDMTFYVDSVSAVNARGDVAGLGTAIRALPGGVDCLWVVRDGVARIEVMADSPPGLPLGVVVDDFEDIALDDLGRVSFRARLEGPAITGPFDVALFWQDCAGTISAFAQEGEPFPGTTLDIHFAEIYGLPASPRGQFAFAALLSGADVSPAQNMRQFIVDRARRPHSVAHRTEMVDLGAAGPRFILVFQITSTPSLNSRGELAQRVVFTDQRDAIMLYRWIEACPADFTGSADPNHAAYGVGDDIVDIRDFFFYLDQFSDGIHSFADLTGSSDPTLPSYGVPDGIIDASDFFYYLDQFALGCP